MEYLSFRIFSVKHRKLSELATDFWLDAVLFILLLDDTNTSEHTNLGPMQADRPVRSHEGATQLIVSPNFDKNRHRKELGSRYEYEISGMLAWTK